VYLACDPEVSFKRMSERGRPEESNNTLEYITQLEDAHEDMLPDLCEKFDIPFLRLDYTHFMRPGEVAESILTIKRLTNARQVSIR
jgi:deoxyadenosine/deoxycytidine kinase